MVFEKGQKVRHKEYGTVGTFLGVTEEKKFSVILDGQELPLTPMPIQYTDKWEAV